MKKFFIFILLVALAGGGIFIYMKIDKKNSLEKRIKEVKSGWYVEIHTDYINLREKPDQYSKAIGKVTKGHIHKAIDIDLNDKAFIWYKIEVDEKTTGWIANPREGNYLIDHNNPNDIMTPKIKLLNEDYHVDSIKDITDDNIEVTDDKKDYTIKHAVYRETINKAYNIYHYWIKYTVTDKSGKVATKTQSITFNMEPTEKEVLPFKDISK